MADSGFDFRQHAVPLLRVGHYAVVDFEVFFRYRLETPARPILGRSKGSIRYAGLSSELSEEKDVLGDLCSRRRGMRGEGARRKRPLVLL